MAYFPGAIINSVANALFNVNFAKMNTKLICYKYNSFRNKMPENLCNLIYMIQKNFSFFV